MTASKSQVCSHTNAYFKDKATHRLVIWVDDLLKNKTIAIDARQNEIYVSKCMTRASYMGPES
jgi:hypothetical protein